MLKKIIIITSCSIAVTSAFAGNVYCPQQVTINCPANTQQCKIVSPLPAPWHAAVAGSNFLSDKEREVTVQLTHAGFVYSLTGYSASCLYGLYTDQDPVGSISAYQVSFEPVYAPGSAWKRVPSRGYDEAGCPNGVSPYLNNNYPIANTLCPFA